MEEYCALVLGCTHFNYFKPAYRQIFGEETLLIDGNHGTVKHLAEVLGLKLSEAPDDVVEFNDIHKMLEKSKTDYFYSGKPITGETELERLRILHNRLEFVRKK